MTDQVLIPPSAFDRDFYLAANPDVALAGVDPWEHYQRWGSKEGRTWSEAVQPLDAVIRRRPGIVEELIAQVPKELRVDLLTDKTAWTVLRSMVHPAFYSAQVSGSTAPELGTPGEGGELWTVDDVLEHYLTVGMRENLRPSLFFHDQWYRELMRDQHGVLVEGPSLLHWLAVGRPSRVTPTPLFEQHIYEMHHRDMAQLPYWSFEHFVSHGAYEPFRKYSPVVQHLVAAPTARQDQYPLMLPEVLRDSGVDALSSSTPLEERALLVARKRARLSSPTMAEMVEKAYQIEPLVRRPYGAREISVPPLINHATELARRGETVRRELGITTVDTIVMVPHVRMAGSARVAGVFAQTMRALDPDGTVLVLTTEAETFERPDWFGSEVLVGDISASSEGLPEEAKTRLALDVVRGLQPRRVINVNSRRGWELFRLFGRQISAFTDLYSYLFTWDLDIHGNKGGYPIAFFPECFGHLKGVLVDSAPLRDELVGRYGHSKELAQRITLVHTPFDPLGNQVDHSAVFQGRRERGVRRRFIWCGRFDRQKRFDVVADLAQKLPDDEFWVWGKTVLGGLDVDMTDLPENIKMQGTYREFDDLPFESADAFLYTAEWDGVPTILIDAGIRGVATVASAVGGVTDIVDATTGYPVAEFDDADAYVQVIEEMSADPAAVTSRARAMREHVRRVCSPQLYQGTVREVLGLAQTMTGELKGA